MNFDKYVEEHIYSINSLLGIKDEIENIAKDIKNCLLEGRTVFVCGNGGSASDAQHFTAELVGSFYKESRKPLNVICLNSNIANITSIANDKGYDKIFSEQLKGLGRSRDILVLLSTSYSSRNLIEVSNTAYSKGIRTICLPVMGEKTYSKSITQEIQMTCLHIIAGLVEDCIIESTQSKTGKVVPITKVLQ